MSGPLFERATGVDAFTREIIRNKLVAIAGEMGIVLARTSMSPIVYEVLDFACGITDVEARVIAQDNGLCLFTGTFKPQVESVLNRHPLSSMRPGDVYMTNGPYGGGRIRPTWPWSRRSSSTIGSSPSASR